MLSPGELEAFGGGPPASVPQGDPVGVAFAAPKLGTVRMRVQQTAARYEEVSTVAAKQKLSRELTRKLFRIREEIDALEGGRVSNVRAVVLEAREVIDVNGRERPTTLLQGEYLVDVSKPGRILARHATGRSLTGREHDELGDLYAIDAGDEPTIVTVVRDRRLRLRESVMLTAAERELVAGAGAAGPIALTFVDLANERATFQLDASASLDSRTKIARTTRERHTIDVTTGQLLEAVFDTLQSEHGTQVAGELRARTHLRFESASD